MLNYDEVVKNSKAFKMVELDLSGSRLSHAYLFVSKDNAYLKFFVETICEIFINENDKENAEKNSMRIKKHVHPDVKFFGEEKAVDAAAANQIVDLSGFSPFEADKKIFVMANADSMNESSQNKILKTIEEPPKNTYFILSGNGTAKLLPTILSRVKMIDLDEISTEQIAKMLIQNGIDENRAQICASCSNGNAEFAEKLATDGSFVDFFNNIVSCFYEINGSRDVLKFSNIFGAKTIDKDEFFDISALIVRDIAVILAGKIDMVVCKNVQTKLKMIASSLNLEAVTTLAKECVEAKKKLNFNVNATSVIDGFLFKLAEVKVKCRRS